MALETDILPPRYDRPQRIGRGGMGEIFYAQDATLGRAVAIKILAERYAQDSDVRDRFTREALAAARLSGHANIVTIFDVGEWNERPFIVMEHLAGGSLENVLREHGAQPPGQVLQWLEQAARALDAAHSNGIVHRDVKPANLLLDRDGNLHVADFGIASATGMDSLTRPGTVLGTAGYLSPEQAQGERATPASDRYALAVVAFELLTGTRPFAADTPTAEAMAHVNAEVPAISQRQPTIPIELDNCFRRALAKDPADRFASALDFVSALRSALDDAAGATRTVPVVPAAAPTRRIASTGAAPPPVPPPAPAPPVYEQEPPAYPPYQPPYGMPERRRPLWPLLLAGLAAAAIAGIALAALLSDDDDEAAPRVATRVQTIERTLPGTTERVTITARAPTTAPVAPTTASPPATTAETEPATGGSIQEGIALTDQATGLMRAGRYGEALPVAQRALSILRGSGHTYEAYANYDVGRSLAELNRCEEAIPYL